MAGRAVCVALLCLSPSFALPQPAEVEASLRVRQVSGQKAFALGELIRLELEFQGRAGSEYAFLGTGDGGFETYSVTPAEDVEDPRAEFQAAGMGIAGNFISSPHPLDGTPMLQCVVLNDWVRFRRPGEYRLFVTSRRLERNRSAALPLTSNTLELRIVAPPAGWLEAEVLRATALLDAGTPDGIREGLAVLRHLGTREAGLALVAHHGAGGESRSYELLNGLIASPGRAEIVKAMEARLDSGSPLSPGFIPDLSLLRSLVDHPVGTVEPQLRFENVRDLQTAYTKRWGRGIARAGASEPAFASVLAGLLGSPGGEAAAELLGSHPDVARAAFLSLPSERQAALLQYQWDAISGWIGPTLETIYAGWRGDGRQSGAGDLALKRIFVADRERGEALIVAEVKTGAHRISTDTLLSFPEDAVKGIDDDILMQRLLAQHSEPAGVTALWLVSRYGSPALVPVVRQMLRCGPPCEIEAAALAYQLKHDPETGVARLQPGFDRSCAVCKTPPWMQLAPRLWDERIEAAAVATLGAPSPDAGQAAAQALQSYGSAKCKEPLLARLVRFKAESPGTEDLSEEEAYSPGGPTNRSPASMFEGALVSALFGNDRLALTDDDVARIRGACVSRGCRDYVEGMSHARADRR
jgi:hypothetical protein